MKLGNAIAEIMKREGIEILCAYPVNHLIECAAAVDIRPVIVRQERTGLHMADAISRVTSGKTHRRVLHAERSRAPRTRSAASPSASPNPCPSWCCPWVTPASCPHRPEL